MTVEDPVTLEYITRYIAGLKQKYTQSNGRRPFGISCLIGGFDYDGKARLYQTEPSGIYYEWKVRILGPCSKLFSYITPLLFTFFFLVILTLKLDHFEVKELSSS